MQLVIISLSPHFSNTSFSIFVLSCLVLSYLVFSCLAFSCLVLSCLVLSLFLQFDSMLCNVVLCYIYIILFFVHTVGRFSFSHLFLMFLPLVIILSFSPILYFTPLFSLFLSLSDPSSSFHCSQELQSVQSFSYFQRQAMLT